ncbi:hypothetical protein CAPTEDRAFT_150361 [Capitella teleta]|uniref:26S proteasome non-ATPase regulatory subunit 2 n=1 Tax=Capitella teleta TaxID=283909 RepID=R7TLF0_CAPTE|nr:hypothetical protein CAPTEDRAFT_150361 [Capitella teleta]|eukprot:ELT94307.1 hypothetical protein CAPTEDRAFT_150361 [Capitella teleta]
MLVERLQEPNQGLYKASLESMRTLIRSSTTSMTSVPKPLKFLRPHYETLKTVHEKITDQTTKRFCADVVSVLGMTLSQTRECLRYRSLGSHEAIGSWGHEYVRHLTGEISQEWQVVDDEKTDSPVTRDELNRLINEVVPYLMGHNAEAEACDLLMEVEKLAELEQYVDDTAYTRVCLYLKSCVPYVPEPENTNLLKTCLAIYRKFNQFPDALQCTLALNDMELVKEVFLSCKDLALQKQLALTLGRQQIFMDLEEEGVAEADVLNDLISNSHLNTNFVALARELDIMEPKVPEDIYKSNLEPSRPGIGPGNIDSARHNLAASFVNGFVNTAFGKDKLLEEEGNKWLYKNKEHGMMSATATLGLILLWDIDGGLTQIDKYLYSSEDYIKAGALLACGIVTSGVRNECDPALALLSDYVLHSNNTMRIGAIAGLGLAYAGSNREDVISLLLPAFADANSTMEVVGAAALACGLIAVGSCNGDVTSTILQTLIEKSEKGGAELKDTNSRYLALGLGLTYLGKQESVDTILAALEVVPEPFKSFASTMVDVCAYAGTGNVLKVQTLLHVCSEHYESKDPDNNDNKKEDKNKNKKEEKAKEKETEKPNLSSQQGIAVLGISLISMGEEVGADMAFRTCGHLMRYGEPAIRRAVPLALAMSSASNPKLQILDTLSKFSHDSDAEVAHNSILAMGIVGAGTNNARLAAMLRQLAVYHAKDPNNLFCVRIAQGLTHMGKGTLTLCPYQNDRQLMNPNAVAGILAVLVALLDVKNTVLGKSHYVLFNLVAAMQPRMLVTFDEDLRPLPVSVRVGQAVDVVGQAGKPKTITGFQTHTTPVLLAYGERAELATEEFISMTPTMEGFVILKKNENYEAPEVK